VRRVEREVSGEHAVGKLWRVIEDDAGPRHVLGPVSSRARSIGGRAGRFEKLRQQVGVGGRTAIDDDRVRTADVDEVLLETAVR
jgi:hypothetical protein